MKRSIIHIILSAGFLLSLSNDILAQSQRCGVTEYTPTVEFGGELVLTVTGMSASYTGEAGLTIIIGQSIVGSYTCVGSDCSYTFTLPQTTIGGPGTYNLQTTWQNLLNGSGAGGAMTCFQATVTVLAPAPSPCSVSIQGVAVVDPTCPNTNDGSLTVSAVATGCTGGLLYRVDGGTLQPSNTFNGLGPGSHNIAVLCSSDHTCIDLEVQSLVGVDNSPPILITCGSSSTVDPAYDDGWQLGDNDGSGFGPWQLSTQNNDGSQGGHFLGTVGSNNSSISNGGASDTNADGDIDASGSAFGLYANSGDVSQAIRPFARPMGAGSSIKLQMDNGWIEPGGTVGFGFQNAAGNNLLEVFFQNGALEYTLVGGTSMNTGIPFTDQGIEVEIRQLDLVNCDVIITTLFDGTSYSFSMSLSSNADQEIAQLRLFNANAGGGVERNAFFNNFEICHPCPPDINVYNDSGICGAVVNFTDPTASDNCPNPMVTCSPASGSVFPEGRTTVTCTATDAAGNQSNCSFNVIVVDAEPPVAVCSPYTVALDATGQYAISIGDLQSITAASTDNCGVDGYIYNFSHLTCDNLGTSSRTIRVLDLQSQDSECTFDLTVTDPLGVCCAPPNAVCRDITVQLDAGGNASISAGPEELANSSAEFSGTQGQDEWTYGQHAAFDAAGFAQLSNFTGSVWNNPGSGEPLDFPQLDPNGGHPAINSLFWAVRRWTSDYHGSIIISGDFFDRDGNCGDGAHVRIFKNGVEVYQYLNIPTASIPYTMNLGVSVGDEIDFAIDPIFDAGCDDTHFTAVITSNDHVNNGSTADCGLQSMTVNPSTFTCDDVGGNTVTLTVTDINNEVSTCTATVTVEDNVPPTITCPSDITIFTDPGTCESTNVDATSLYALTNTSTSKLLMLETDEFEVISQVPYSGVANNALSDMALNPVNGLYYVVYREPFDTFFSVSKLGTIDPLTGVVTEIATLGAGDVTQLDYSSITFSPDGRLFAIVLDYSTGTYSLEELDPLNGDIIMVLSGLSTDGNICFNPIDGHLYMFRQAGFIADILKIDTTTFASTPISLTGVPSHLPTPNLFQINSCTYSGNNSFYVSTSYNEIPSTGIITAFYEVDTAGALDSIAPAQERYDSGLALRYNLPLASACATVEQTVGIPFGNPYPLGPTLNTFTATNIGGESVECSYTVTVVDNDPPEIACPPNQTAVADMDNCFAIVDYPEVTATDICSGMLSPSLISGLASGSQFPVGTEYVAYEAVDAAGNSAQCYFSVTVTEEENPEIECVDLIQGTDPGSCEATLAFDPMISDNCQAIKLAEEEVFDYTGDIVLWTVPDGVESLRITAAGAQGSNNNAQSDASAGLGATMSGEFAVNPGDQLKILVGQQEHPIGRNGGGGGSYVTDMSDNPLIIAGGGGGSGDRDAYGKHGSSGLTGGSPLFGGTGGTAGNGGVGNSLANGSGGGLLTDGDGGRDPEHNGSAFVNGGAGGVSTGGYGGGGVGAGWTRGGGGGGYSGGAGAAFETLQGEPLGSVGGGGGSFNGGTGQLNSSGVNTGHGRVTISYGLPYELVSGMPVGSVVPVGTTVVNEILVTDLSGNTATCSFNVTVNDTEPPTITCPYGSSTDVPDVESVGVNIGFGHLSYSDVSGSCRTSGQTYVAGATGFLTSIVLEVCTLNIGGVVEVGVYDALNGTLISTSSPQTITGLGTVQFDFPVPPAQVAGEDYWFKVYSPDINSINMVFCGGSSTYSAGDLTIPSADLCSSPHDNIIPIVDFQFTTLVSDGYIVSADAGECGAVVTYTEPTPSDNCPGATVVCSPASGSVFPVGTTVVTCTATDAANNSASCSFTVTVNDVEPPTITCPTVDVPNDPGACGAFVDYEVTTTDNCPEACVDVTMMIRDFHTSGNTQTWQLAGPDGTISGGPYSGSQTFEESFCLTPGDYELIATDSWIQINDGFAPEYLISSPEGVEVHILENSWDGSTSATFTIDPVGLQVVCDPPTGSFFTVGTTPVTCTATDAAGNENTCTFTVTVNDVEPPIALCQDLTIELDAEGNASITAEQINNGSTDNCLPVELALSQTTFTCDDVASGALDFDGVDDHVQFPAGLVSTSNDFTFEAWVFQSSQTYWERIMDFGTGTNEYMYLIPSIGYNGPARFAITVNSWWDEEQITAPDPLPLNTWTHIAVTIEDATNTGTMYINGDPVAQNTFMTLNPSSLGSTSQNWLGRSQYSHDGYFSGQMDEVRIWSTARTQEEIQSNMRNILSGSESGLIAYHPFEDPSGSTTSTDASGNGNTGTLIDMGPDTDWVLVPPSSTIIGSAIQLTVTDPNGNSDTCISTVTVEDNIAPSISCPMDINVDKDPGICGAVVTYDTPTIIDNCPRGTVSCFPGSGFLFKIGTTLVTCTATDAGGNTATCSFTVTVVDNEAPTIDCPLVVPVPNDMGMCGAEVSIPLPTADDDCAIEECVSLDDIESYDLDLILGQSASWDTWTPNSPVESGEVSTDEALSGTKSVKISGLPEGGPVDQLYLVGNQTSGDWDLTYSMFIPEDRTAYTNLQKADPGVESAHNIYYNSAGLIHYQVRGTISSFAYPQGQWFKVRHHIDLENDWAEFYIDDVLLISHPHTYSPLSSGGLLSLQSIDFFPVTSSSFGIEPNPDAPPLWYIDDISFCPVRTDVNVLTVQNDFNDGTDATGFYPVGTTTVTFTATDGSGNMEQCAIDVTVEDTEDPTITCPEPADLIANALDCSVDISPANTGMASATDNCDDAPEISFTDESTQTFDGTSTDHCYEITRTWTATDDAGNGTSCTQTITVTDNTAPIWTTESGALDMTFECSDDQALSDAQSVFPVAQDNCDPDVSNIVKVPGEPEATDDCPQVGVIVNTWTVLDACGNTSATYTQTITLIDTTEPVITFCPADANVEGGGSTDPSVLGEATATDNCDLEPNVTFEDLVEEGGCDAEGGITRVWKATDACGNTTYCLQTITVTDNTPPVIECVGDVMVSCEESTDPQETGTPTATDESDSDVAITHVDISSQTDNGSCSDHNYQIVRVWTATDDCGNSTFCKQTITVFDTTPPEITCPGTLYVEPSDGLPEPDFAGGSTSDNCDGAVAVTFVSDVSDGQSEPETVTRTYRATDACGNTAECSHLIIIDDITGPMMTCPNDTTVTCIEDVPAPDVDAVQTNSDCGATVTYVGDVASEGTCPLIITRTYHATDECGNSMTCAQSITVHDLIPPVIDCPSDATVTCEEDQSPANTGSATATDNCTADIDIYITFSDDLSALTACKGTGTILRTWTATDACDNTMECIQTITVNDSGSPTIDCPSEVTVSCIDEVPEVDLELTTFDGCGGEVTVSHVSDISDGNSNPETITRTYLAMDECDNTATCTQTIIVDDTAAPSITCPDDISVDNDPGLCSAVVTFDTPEGTDACGTATVVCTPASGSAFPVGETTVSCVATDEAGNSTECTFTVTVHDVEPQVIDQEGFVDFYEVPFDPEVCGAEVDVLPPTASDNCGIESMVNDYNGTSSGLDVYPAGKETDVTWTISFNDGTTESLTATVKVGKLNAATGLNTVCFPAQNKLKFKWNTAPGAQRYRIQMRDLFGNIVLTIDKYQATAVSHTLTMTDTLNAGNNQWRVISYCKMDDAPNLPGWQEYAKRYTSWKPLSLPCTHQAALPFDGTSQSIKLIDSGVEAEVYPNPTEGIFYLDTDMEDYTLEVYDLKGQQVYMETRMRKGITELDLQEAPNGMYLLKMYNNSAIMTKRITIQR